MANFLTNLYRRMTTPTDASIDNVLYGNQQEKLEVPINERIAAIGQKLGNAVLGTPVGGNNTIGVMTTDAEGNYVMPMGVQNKGREGGLLRDLAQGYKENRNNAFSLDNWDGEKKNAVQKIGEMLGTTARFIDSPLGRGVLAYGASNMIGDTNPLEQALTATVKNKNLRTADQLYRQELQNQGVDTSNLKGYVNGDIFKNYSLANYRNNNLDVKMQLGQLKDNTSRAKMISTMLNNGMITPEEALARMNEYGIQIGELDESNQTKLLPYKQFALKTAPQVALGNLGVNQGNLNLKQQKYADEKEFNDRVSKVLENMGIAGKSMPNSKTSSTKTTTQKPTTNTNTIKSSNEGRIIVNKQTGERMIMRNGKWQKI